MDALNERLIREKEIRQEFFANASHELKTPITSIRGYAELLESDMIKDEDTKRDMISRIKKEADHMNMLIADILEVSKLESNEFRPDIMRVDMSVLIDEAIETFRPRAEDMEISLYNYAKPGVFVYADYGHMDEIVSNLVSNAIRYNRRRCTAGSAPSGRFPPGTGYSSPPARRPRHRPAAHRHSARTDKRPPRP